MGVDERLLPLMEAVGIRDPQMTQGPIHINIDIPFEDAVTATVSYTRLLSESEVEAIVKQLTAINWRENK